MRRHVAHLLTAYIHNELPPHLRQRVERHTRTCDRCYAALVRERDLTRLLENRLTTIGRARPEQLARLLPGILAEVAKPAPPTQSRRNWLPGFGLALVFSLALVLVGPVLAGAYPPQQVAPNQPAPYMLAATATAGLTDAPLAVAASPTEVAQRLEAATQPADLSPAPAPIAATAVQ